MPPTPERRKRPTGKLGAPSKEHSNPVNRPRSAGAQAAQLVADPRFRRRMERFWPLGSRVAAELLAQLAASHDCRREVESFLDRAVENEQALREFGFDKWPPLPLRTVRP